MFEIIRTTRTVWKKSDRFGKIGIVMLAMVFPFAILTALLGLL